MVSTSWSRFGWVLAAAGLLAAMALPAASRQPRAYGRHLVAQYQLPAQAVARYAAMAAGTAGTLSASRGSSMFADRSPWLGPEQRAGVGSNPYTLVLTVSGVAPNAGDVYTRWQTGWEVHESPTTSREVLMTLPAVTRADVAAGERVSLTGHSGPVSFRGERLVAPMLGVVQTRNLDIDEVRLQVWSGPAPVAWPVSSLSPTTMMAMAAACLLLWWRFRHRQDQATSTAAPAARMTDRPSQSPADSDPIERCTGLTARDAPRPADPGHTARVIEALQQVLATGLAVTTVFDPAHMHEMRAADERRTTSP
jgi:hypothetical protein